MAGPEFCTEQGKLMLVVRAQRELKFSGKAFRDLLYEQLYGLGYKLSIADTYKWIIPSIKLGEFM